MPRFLRPDLLDDVGITEFDTCAATLRASVTAALAEADEATAPVNSPSTCAGHPHPSRYPRWSAPPAPPPHRSNTDQPPQTPHDHRIRARQPTNLNCRTKQP